MRIGRRLIGECAAGSWSRYFKCLKYGDSRGNDIVSQHIRAGRLTREDGGELVRLNDGKFP